MKLSLPVIDDFDFTLLHIYSKKTQNKKLVSLKNVLDEGVKICSKRNKTDHVSKYLFNILCYKMRRMHKAYLLYTMMVVKKSAYMPFFSTQNHFHVK